MSDLTVSIIAFPLAGFFAWHFFNGFRTGSMQPIHWGLDAADRIEQPLLFWIYAIINGMLMVGALWAAIGLFRQSS